MNVIPKTAPYMSIIPMRQPRRKPHLTLGQAKKAVLAQIRGEELAGPCMVYQWIDNQGWERLWSLPAATKREDLPWKPTVAPLTIAEKHETVSELIQLGATLEEIIERGPFGSWGALRGSLLRRDRTDLLDALYEKQARVGMAELGNSAVQGGRVPRTNVTESKWRK